MARKNENSLGTFEGRDVIQQSVAVTNAGDGLSKALAVDPTGLSLGDEVYVVLRTHVAKVRYEEVTDTDCLMRVHSLKASDATIVDGTLVKDVLDAQVERIEAAKGIQQLPLKLVKEHEAGEHAAGLVEGCPACDEEEK